MKNLFFILTLLVAFSSTAQLTVRETQKDSIMWRATKVSVVPKIMVYTIDTVHVHTIFYKNAKYTQITDIESITIGDNQTTKEFFQTCLTAFTESKEFLVEIDGDRIYIKKSMGSVMIWNDSSYFYLTKNQIENILSSLSQ